MIASEKMQVLKRRIQLINDEAHSLRVKKILTSMEMLKEVFSLIPTLNNFGIKDDDYPYGMKMVNGIEGYYDYMGDENEAVDMGLLVKTDLTRDEMKLLVNTIHSFDNLVFKLLRDVTHLKGFVDRESILNDKLFFLNESYLNALKAVNDCQNGDGNDDK